MISARRTSHRPAHAALIGVLLLAGAAWLAWPTAPDSGDRSIASANAPAPAHANGAQSAAEGSATGLAAFAARTTDEVQRLQLAAERGDVAAMRELVEIANGCFLTGFDPATVPTALDHGRSMLRKNRGKAAADAYQRAGERMQIRCAALLRHEKATHGLVALWRQRAADAGDLSARIMFAIFEPGGHGTDVAALADEAFATGEPHALRAIGPLLAFSKPTSQTSKGGPPTGYEAAFSAPQTIEALSLIACERGLDCGADSLLMDTLCVNAYECMPGQPLPALVESYTALSGQGEELIRAQQRMRELLRDAPPVH